MAHGIIEHTANLEYRFQPGALNESIADVFGAMIDDDDWLIGEDIVKEAYFPSGALRNLEDPHNGDHANGWQPAHMDEFVDLSEDEDYGGVHINSGIPTSCVSHRRCHWPGAHGTNLLPPTHQLPNADQQFCRLSPSGRAGSDRSLRRGSSGISGCKQRL